MKLLVNLSTLGARPTGLGVYSARCAQALHAAFDAEAVAPASYRGDLPVARLSPPSIALGAGRGAAIRRLAWSLGPGRTPGRFVYSPTHHGLDGALGQVLTVHDLIALRFPRQHPTQYVYFRHILPRQLQRCSAVFTVSETSRMDLNDRMGVPLDRIHVVPSAVDTELFVQGHGQVLREDFLLVVGAAYAHKNVTELIDQAPLWARRYRLVIASSRGKYRRVLEQQVAQRSLQARVHFADYLTQAELVSLYQRCAAFVYPSLWEGFGLPPLEALASGARVIVSDISALREVLGEAADFVTLGDASSWERAFTALERERSAAQLEAASRVLARHTWQHSAQALKMALMAVGPHLQTR